MFTAAHQDILCRMAHESNLSRESTKVDPQESCPEEMQSWKLGSSYLFMIGNLGPIDLMIHIRATQRSGSFVCACQSRGLVLLELLFFFHHNLPDGVIEPIR